MVGTPEYIGTTKHLRIRIKQHIYDAANDTNDDHWWWREDWIDLAVCIEIDGEKLSQELETFLIKILSPQVNKNKLGIK